MSIGRRSDGGSKDSAVSVDHSRRALLRGAFCAGAFGAGARVLAATCAVPGAADSSMRAELHYVEASLEPTRRCTACSFFSAQPGSACGTCEILNGPANPNGHCDSWAARA
jgi:hypothetical protein